MFNQNNLQRDLILSYNRFKEGILLDLCRKHGFRDYDDMMHRGYRIESEIQNIPTENGMVTKETYKVYRIQKIDQVTINLNGVTRNS